MSKEVGGMVESRRVQGAGSARLSDQPCRARFPRTSDDDGSRHARDLLLLFGLGPDILQRTDST